MALAAKKDHDTRTLLASTTTPSGVLDTTAAAARLARPPRGFVFVMNVTAAQTAALDFLAVYIQTRLDDGGGETWHNVVRFANVAGDDGAKQHIEKLTASAPEAGYKADAALAARTVRNIIGDQWRVRYVQSEDTDASFTFSVTAIPM